MPEVLDLVGLDGKAKRMPDELSGGEQQRVAIARAFVNRPLVLLADEPTGNLDPDTSQGIMSLLERINRTGTTVVMATHDNNIVDAMRRRVIELDNGTRRPRPEPRRLRGRPLRRLPPVTAPSASGRPRTVRNSMRANFVMSGVATGIRRNLTMTIALVLNTAIALAFVGAAILANIEITRFQQNYEGKLNVSVYLCAAVYDAPCTGKTTPAQTAQIAADAEARPDGHQRHLRLRGPAVPAAQGRRRRPGCWRSRRR